MQTGPRQLPWQRACPQPLGQRSCSSCCRIRQSCLIRQGLSALQQVRRWLPAVEGRRHLKHTACGVIPLSSLEAAVALPDCLMPYLHLEL